MDKESFIHKKINAANGGGMKDDIRLRWVVVFSMMPIAAVLYAVNGGINIANFSAVIIIAAVLNLLYEGAVRLDKVNAEKIGPFAGCMDVVLISFAVYFTGGIFSPLYLLYFILLIDVSFNNRTSGRYMLYSGFVAAAYTFVYLAGNKWAFAGPGSGEFIVKTAFLAVFVFVINKAAREIRNNVDEIRRQSAEKEYFQKELMESNRSLEEKVKHATSNLEKTNLLLIKKNISLLAAHEIYKSADKTKTKEELFLQVLNIIIPLMKAGGGFILGVNESGAKVRVDAVKIFGGAEKMEEGMNFPVEKDTLIRKIITEKKAVWIEEAAGSGEAVFEKSVVNGSVVAAPVVSGGRTTGILVIYNKNPYVYTKTDCELLELLGEQIGALLHNRVLYDEMSAKALGLERLMKVMTNSTTSLARDVIISNLLTESLKRLFSGASGVVMLADDKGLLTIEGVHGYKDDSMLGRKIPRDSIAGFIFMKNRNMKIKDTSKIKIYNQGVDKLYLKKAAVLAPLTRKGTPEGVICITKNKGYFTPDDLHFLSILGNNMISDLEIANLYEKLKNDYINSIYALAAAVDAKDHYTHGHSTTVMKYSERMARAVDLPEWEVEDIKYAALLHDIGKIGISENIINKPSKLTKEEFAVIKMHPQLGANIISKIESLKRLAPLVASHHEWINGNGYPMGLRGDEISIGGKIIAIADAFSTITAKRPYREARTIEEGLKELKRCTGTQFDRDLVEVFCEIMESELDEFEEDIEKERRGHAPEKSDIRRIRVKIDNNEIDPDIVEKDDEFYS